VAKAQVGKMELQREFVAIRIFVAVLALALAVDATTVTASGKNCIKAPVIGSVAALVLGITAG
jgi:hypothetical protein